jgi:Circularly permutated YpsA SLOG family
VFAKRLKKPCLVVQLDHGVTADVVAQVLEWVRQYEIKTLNVAGPRESKRPGIYRLSRELLDQVDAASHSKCQSAWLLQLFTLKDPGCN